MDFLPDSLAAECWVLAQATIAILLGGLVGWERETAGKWAGFRTHMLVCLSAVLFVRLGQFLILDSGSSIPGEYLRADPGRTLEAIVAGVAFLGAGTIFRDRGSKEMKGLTTAASLLTVAAIGVSVALELYVVAGGVTGLAVLILRVLALLERSPKPSRL